MASPPEASSAKSEPEQDKSLEQTLSKKRTKADKKEEKERKRKKVEGTTEEQMLKKKPEEEEDKDKEKEKREGSAEVAKRAAEGLPPKPTKAQRQASSEYYKKLASPAKLDPPLPQSVQQ